MENNTLNINIKSLPKGYNWKSPAFWISIVALGVSIVSMCFTKNYNTGSSTAEPLSISSYSIVRSLDPFPSDHLVIPIEWVNKGGRPALVRQPILILKEKSSDRTLYFFVAGQFPELSNTAVNDPYKRSQSFLIESHSARTLTLIFHIENWWNKINFSAYNFHFTGQEKYAVLIRFLDEIGNCFEADLGTLDTYDAGDLTDDKRGYWYGFWPTDLGHRNGQPPDKAPYRTNFRPCSVATDR